MKARGAWRTVTLAAVAASATGALASETPNTTSLTEPLPAISQTVGTQTQQTQPFSEVLRSALKTSKNSEQALYHDLIGKTRFQDRLKAHDFTVDQYKFHLTQRYLMHKALDDVLSSKDAQKNPVVAAIYGAGQKEALSNLVSDLKALGIDAAKLTDKDATKITKTALSYIRTDCKSDLYKGVGYLHTLTGGLPFGGRMIGGEIETSLKTKMQDVPLAYYTKSLSVDYYMEKHAPALDMITDKKQRDAAIAGGIQAYVQLIQAGQESAYDSK